MTIRDLTAVALFAALIAAFGFVPVIPAPFIPVPITSQTLGVTLAGALLGAKRGFCAVAVVWLLVAVGLPILSGGHGGISSFFSPTTGYLIGWGFSAFTIGALYSFFRPSLTLTKEIIALVVGGIVVMHTFGVVWLAFFTHMPFSQAIIGDLIFIPGDLVKLAITYAVVRVIRRGLPNAFNERHNF